MNRKALTNEITWIISNYQEKTEREIAEKIVEFVLTEVKEKIVLETLDSLGQAIRNQGY